MPQFAPDQVTFGDIPGYGNWDIAHAREHQQFIQVLAQQTPSIPISAYNLLAFLTAGDQRRGIGESHREVHQALSAALGITGTDYTQYNLDDSSDFYTFLGYHSTDHAAIRQALGIT